MHKNERKKECPVLCSLKCLCYNNFFKKKTGKMFNIMIILRNIAHLKKHEINFRENVSFNSLILSHFTCWKNRGRLNDRSITVNMMLSLTVNGFLLEPQLVLGGIWHLRHLKTNVCKAVSLCYQCYDIIHKKQMLSGSESIQPNIASFIFSRALVKHTFAIKGLKGYPKHMQFMQWKIGQHFQQIALFCTILSSHN